MNAKVVELAFKLNEKKPRNCLRGFLNSGGERGIRTPGRL